jgi:hypothetical protein
MISYSTFLVISAVLFIVAERLWPRANQPVLRSSFATDLLYLVFNAEVVGALVSIWLAGWMPQQALQAFRVQWLVAMPEPVQVITLLTVKDFLQW